MDKIEKGIIVIAMLQSHAHEAYIVGGAVRDYLLGLSPEDIDITTSASVEEVEKIFDDVDSSSKKYGSIRIFFESDLFEITQFRKDLKYADHRHPEVCFAKTLEEDLIRRDFTINALAMKDKHTIIDLFGGKNDLNNKILKTIGRAEERFEEDGLRVLRAIYFCGKLGFQLDKEIKDALRKDFVCFLPKEYIKLMVEKILDLPSSNGIRYLCEYNVLKGFPFYRVLAEECYRYGIRSNNCYALFYYLHHFLPSNERIQKKEINDAVFIAKLINNNFSILTLYETNSIYIKPAVELYNAVFQQKLSVKKIEDAYERLPIHSSKDLAEHNCNHIEPCKRALIIKHIERAILQGEIANDADEIKNYMRKCLENDKK